MRGMFASVIVVCSVVLSGVLSLLSGCSSYSVPVAAASASAGGEPE